MKKPIKNMYERLLMRDCPLINDLYSQEIAVLKIKRAIDNILNPIMIWITKQLNKI